MNAEKIFFIGWIAGAMTYFLTAPMTLGLVGIIPASIITTALAITAIKNSKKRDETK